VARDRRLCTPLIYAVLVRHVEFVRMLLERGAVIDAQSISGTAALSHAAARGDIQAVRLLLEHGADINVCDDEGKTASQVPTEQEIGAKSV
jgi:ankyrin repeat protein